MKFFQLLYFLQFFLVFVISQNKHNERKALWKTWRKNEYPKSLTLQLSTTSSFRENILKFLHKNTTTNYNNSVDNSSQLFTRKRRESNEKAEAKKGIENPTTYSSITINQQNFNSKVEKDEREKILSKVMADINKKLGRSNESTSNSSLDYETEEIKPKLLMMYMKLNNSSSSSTTPEKGKNSGETVEPSTYLSYVDEVIKQQKSLAETSLNTKVSKPTTYEETRHKKNVQEISNQSRLVSRRLKDDEKKEEITNSQKAEESLLSKPYGKNPSAVAKKIIEKNKNEIGISNVKSGNYDSKKINIEEGFKKLSNELKHYLENQRKKNIEEKENSLEINSVKSPRQPEMENVQDHQKDIFQNFLNHLNLLGKYNISPRNSTNDFQEFLKIPEQPTGSGVVSLTEGQGSHKSDKNIEEEEEKDIWHENDYSSDSELRDAINYLNNLVKDFSEKKPLNQFIESELFDDDLILGL